MVEESAHLVDSVIPQVPVRQWVLTLPYALRYILAWNLRACTAVLGALMRTITRHCRKRAKRDGIELGHIGAIGVCQRFNAALHLHLHWHVLVSDGLWHESWGRTHFRHAPALKDEEVAAVLNDAETRILRQMRKFGWDDNLPPLEVDALEAKARILATCMCGAMSEARLKEKPSAMREKGERPSPKPAGRNCCQRAKPEPLNSADPLSLAMLDTKLKWSSRRANSFPPCKTVSDVAKPPTNAAKPSRNAAQPPRNAAEPARNAAKPPPHPAKPPSTAPAPPRNRAKPPPSRAEPPPTAQGPARNRLPSVRRPQRLKIRPQTCRYRSAAPCRGRCTTTRFTRCRTRTFPPPCSGLAWR